MATAHKRYGSSTATRTLGCPNWQNICDKYAPKIERTSVHAERGTKLHDIMEVWLTTTDGALEDLEPLLGELSEDDADACRSAGRMMIEVLDSYGIEEMAVEMFLDVDQDVGGTPDLLGWTDSNFINVDYKFGHGEIEDRNQFLFGFMAVLEGGDCKDMDALREAIDGKLLTSVVIQPAVSDKPLIECHDWEELDEFTDEFFAALEVADKGGLEGTPGKHCKYCPAAARCPAQRAQAKAFQQLDVEVDDDLAAAMDMIEAVEEHARAVRAECFAALGAGRKVPGWKLVEKQARRHWVNEQAALDKFKRSRKVKSTVYLDEKLRSPAQVEKALAKAEIEYDFGELVTKKSSGNTIARESDKRPAVQVTAPAALDAIMGGGDG